MSTERETKPWEYENDTRKHSRVLQKGEITETIVWDKDAAVICQTTEQEPCYASPIVCPHCDEEIKLLLPVSPLYDLETVRALIPCTMNQLRTVLETYKDYFPKRYRKVRPKSKLRVIQYRMLTAYEVRMLRQMFITGKKSHKTRSNTYDESAC